MISHEKARETLFYIDDVFSAGQIPYFVRGETLKHILKSELLNEGLEIGVMNRYLTEFGLGVLRANLVLKITKKRGKIVEITSEHNGVPLHVKVYHRNYAMIKNPGTIFYQYDVIPIPNPPEKLLRADGMLR